MRSFLRKDLVVVEEVSAEYELARILFQNQDKTVFFENIKGYGDFKVVGNLVSSRERMCEALNTTREDFISRVIDALENPVEPVVSDEMAAVNLKNSLMDLPVPKYFEKDAGRYITSGIVVATDEEHGRNVSVHRLQVLDKKRLAIRLVERHLYEYYKKAEEKGEPLEVAVALGVHPAVLFAASYSVPLGYDEFRLASSLLGRPLELARCETVDLEVPADSEIVLEGKLLPYERVDEGPFTDITGTYDVVRKQPVLEVTRISHREGAIYHALLPSGIEHKIYMGMPQEPRIFESVSRVASPVNVCLTEGGCNWLHGVVAIAKKGEKDGKKAIEAALEGHPSMKHVVIVDDDIDIFNPVEVEFAIATRFQGNRDIVMIENVRGSSLDPSASKSGLTTKVGIDATKPLGREKDFEKAKFPGEF
jgi:UbiD family decarboxylase